MSVRKFAFLLLTAIAVVAHADEASVKRGVENRLGGLKADSVTKTPYAGLYEVVVGESILYTDEKVNFVFRGEIIDARSQQNYTEERQQQAVHDQVSRTCRSISPSSRCGETANAWWRSSPIRSVRTARASTGR